MKKISLFHLFNFEIQSILVSHDQTGQIHFWPCPHKKFWSTSNFCESVSTSKKSVYSICYSICHSVTDNFRVLSHDWPHASLTRPTPKIFNHLLFCMIFHQHAKYQVIASVYFWDTVNFRVQRPDLLNLLWRNCSFKNHTIWLA